MACYIFLRYNKDNYAKELTEKSDLNETYFEVQEPAWTDGFSISVFGRFAYTLSALVVHCLCV